MGFREIEYLGYTVGRGQLKPQKKKVEAIFIATWPQTKKHLRQFLGMVGYYSRFISRFATRASTLTDMLGKRQPEKLPWDARAQEAFEDLRHTLVYPPVLVNPDFTRPFLVQRDSSGTGLGSIFAQILDGEEHPIIFISSKLQPAEQKCGTIEREALVVKWAIETLQFYLVNNSFTLLLTNHAPLQSIHKVKDSNFRVLQWYLRLLSFSFQILHRRGSANGNADYLSRLFDTNYDTGGM